MGTTTPQSDALSPGSVRADAAARATPATEQLRHSRWAIRGLRDVLLVVLGAALAYAADAFRDARAERRRTRYAIASIRAELTDNLRRAERAHAWHTAMADTLSVYRARHALPPERVYLGGVFVPARLQSAAWQTARETGAVAGLPYRVLLRLAPVYQNQADYNALGNSIAEAAMIDILRSGVLSVFRDRFANFVPLERDFATREAAIIRGYSQALAELDSLEHR